MVSKFVLREVGKNKFWKFNAIHFTKKFVSLIRYLSFQYGFLLITFLGISICFVNHAFATNYHITVNGKPTGDGSINNPWDLESGISGKYGAPGDTIWLHGGVYRGQFTSQLKGSTLKYLVLAQYPGETAIIDGYGGTQGIATLEIGGSYAVYLGFQVLNSSTKRLSSHSGSFPADIQHGSGIQLMGSYVKLVNLIIRNNLGNGIGFWKSAINSEIHGCIIYNNGWQGPDRGHGPGIYAQNETGLKHIKENIIFGGFSRGIQIYGVNGGLTGINIEGNTMFNAGNLAKSALSNIIIGGESAADLITLKDNNIYKTFNSSGINVQVHFSNTLNGSLNIQNNRFVGGDPVLSIKDWQKVSFGGNSVYGKSRIIDFSVQSTYLKSYVWNNNNYNSVNTSNSMDGFTYDGWKKYTSFDGNSSFSTSNPVNEIIVRPNFYERGSGTITIINNQQSSSVEIDLSKILTIGSEYEIKDVENYMGQPLISGKYNGAKITLPMNLTATDKPPGVSSVTHSDVRFGVFVVKTIKASINPPVVIINQPPTLNGINDPAPINEDIGLQTINLTGITSGGENQTLSVSAISDNPVLIPHPEVKYSSPQTTGSITYSPAANRSGSAKITVIVNDGGASNNTISRTFNVVVNPVNDPPTLNALNDLYVEGNSGTHTINLSGITAGPFENQKINISATSSNIELIPNPLISYSSPNASGILKFTTVNGKSGSAIISIKVVDDGLGTSPHINTLIRTFTITVGAIENKPPTLNPINNPLTINEDAGQQTINLSGITEGQGESQTLKVTAISDNLTLIPHPSVQYTSPGTTGTLKYAPVANQSGIANITVKVEDGGATNNFIIRTFKVTVNEINDAPQINAISNLSISANSPAFPVNLTGINAGPFENQVLNITATSNNNDLIPHPVVVYSSPSSTGTLTIKTVAGKSGSAVITVTVTDNGPGIAPHVYTFKRTFTINVSPPEIEVNKHPTLDFINDPAAINEDVGQQTMNLSGITAGQGESQTLKVTAISDNLTLIPHPSVQYTSPGTTGTLKYAPVANRSGIANIIVKVEDGGKENNIITQIFKVVVNEVNDAPQFNVIANVTLPAHTSFRNINLTGINAGIFEQQEITITATSNNKSLIPDPVVSYTSPLSSGILTISPVAGKSGSAVITVTVTDDGPGTEPHENTFSRTFTVTVNELPPQANKQPTLDPIESLTALKVNSPVQTINLTGISAGDGESQTLKVTATTDNKWLIPNPNIQYNSPNRNGTLKFTPVPKRSGTVNITVTVDDGGAENNTILRTFKVTIIDINDAPHINIIDDVILEYNSGAYSIHLSGINAGPSENQAITISATSSNPELIPNPEIKYNSPASSGKLIINPVAEKSGTSEIMVTVTDDGPGEAPHVNTFIRTFNVTVNNNPDILILQPIQSLELFDMENENVTYQLKDGSVFDVSDLPKNIKQLNIKALTNSSDVGSVMFGFNEVENYYLDQEAPFEIAAKNNNTKYKWEGLKVGHFIVSATVYRDKEGREKVGDTYTIAFSIKDSGNTNKVPKVSSITRTYGFNKNYNFRKEDFNTAFVDNEGLQLQKIRIVSLPFEGNLELDGIAVSSGSELLLKDLKNLVYLPKEGSENEDSFIWSGSNGIVYASNVASVKLIPARELNEKSDFKVGKFYPNPVQDQLSIEITSPKANLVNIHISDVQGQLRKSYSSMVSEGENQIKLETFELNSGIYMVTIVNDHQTKTFKIVKRN
ncbi:hypothetical protein BH23BAC1_BH23BAC1_33180 [soil metagenome]